MTFSLIQANVFYNIWRGGRARFCLAGNPHALAAMMVAYSRSQQIKDAVSPVKFQSVDRPILPMVERIVTQEKY